MRAVGKNWTIVVIDTNILIYAYDPTDPVKQTRAQALIVERINDGSFVVSAQVVNEFYSSVTRPNKPPALLHKAAAAIVQSIVDAAVVLPLTTNVTLRALGAVEKHGMSFWDALIWAAARENDVTVIYTEDTPSAPEIEGIRYINPFK